MVPAGVTHLDRVRGGPENSRGRATEMNCGDDDPPSYLAWKFIDI